MEQLVALAHSGSKEPWNKGKACRPEGAASVEGDLGDRIRLQLAERTRELALFNLAVDSKLRSCDLMTLRVRDITHGERIASRAIVMQQKTQRPVQITEQTQDPSPHGSGSRAYAWRTTCSRVASTRLHTCRQGNMRGLSING